LWINEIHNSLIAFGWTQTADTGQINFSTVTRPAGTSIYQGYAIYQMNDSLQATCAVFMRIDFGTGGVADAPSMKIQLTIGGTNGAGTLTGNVGTQQTISKSAASATSTSCRTAGTSSSFRCCMWQDQSGAGAFVAAIERDLNTSGAETATGVNFISINNLTMTSQFIEQAGGLGAVDNKWYAMVSTQTSQSGGGNVGLGPVRTQLGVFRNPMKTMLVYASTDFATGTTNPVTIYGVSHTYLMVKPATGSSLAINSWNANCDIALLWE
jgi:hypothetical protein